MDILVTNPSGRVATIAVDDDRLRRALATLYGVGVSEIHTARCLEANHALHDGKVVEVKGWKFEPIVDAEVA